MSQNLSCTTSPCAVDVRNAENSRASWTYRPHVDIYDMPEALILMADLPGANPESIDLSIESGVLTIQASVPSRAHEGASWVSHEYGVGGFHRRFEIDESIETEDVSAEYRDGSLSIRLPKSRGAQRRRVPVTT